MSPASVTVKDQQVFRVLVDLDERSVVVKGETRPFLAGMGGRADPPGLAQQRQLLARQVGSGPLQLEDIVGHGLAGGWRGGGDCLGGMAWVHLQSLFQRPAGGKLNGVR